MDDHKTERYAIIAIAILALIATIWQGVENRRHYRVSMRPHLMLSSGYFEEFDNFAIKISNGGLGPAIIKSFALIVDGNPLDGSKLSSWDSVIAQLELSGFDYKARTMPAEHVIISGKSVILIRTKTPLNSNSTQEYYEGMSQAFERLEIQVRYDSFYGESFADRLLLK